MTEAVARPTPAHSTASDFATWGPIHLDVTDLSRSLEFWLDLLGLRQLDERDGGVVLGVQDAELVALHPGATMGKPHGHTGLYHIAIHLPSEAEFARVLARLFRARYPNSPTDHIMLWATYLRDPDGQTVELSFETLDRFRGYDLTSRQPAAIDSEGRRRPANAPLDLHQLDDYLDGADLSRPLAPGARIGHIHLNVAALDPALRLYEAIGFAHTVTHSIGMAEMSASGSFPHRLALNVWEGVGARPAPPGAAGMRRACLRLRSAKEMGRIRERVRALGVAVGHHDHGVLIHDPSGNRVALTR